MKMIFALLILATTMSSIACTGSFGPEMRVAAVEFKLDRSLARIELPDINELDCEEQSYSGLWLKTLKLAGKRPTVSYIVNGRTTATNILNRKSTLVLMRTHQYEHSTFSLEDFKTDTVYLLNYSENEGLVRIDLFKRRQPNSRRENVPVTAIKTY